MAIFAVYDTTGVQDFIFASGKFAECRGASILVRSIFAKNGLLENALPQGSITEWKVEPYQSLIENAPAEIISAGGGNAVHSQLWVQVSALFDLQWKPVIF